MTAQGQTLERLVGSDALAHSHTGEVLLRSAADFQLITTQAGFEGLEAEWNALFDRAGRDTQLFQTFNWLWHWAKHFLPRAGEMGPLELAIVTGRRGGRVELIWPLVKERIGPISCLSWMGEPVSQYGDVLVDDVADSTALIDAAWDFVIREAGASVLNLRKVRADSAIAPVLARRGAKVVNELSAPFLDLKSAPSFAEYEKRYSSNARRNRKRQRRRLEDRGAVGFEMWTSGLKAQSLTLTAFELKRAWLEQKGLVSPALADPRTARFFVDATGSETRPAGCHVMALTCGEDIAAIEVGVRAKGRTAIHIIAYSLPFEKTAAGSLLMEDSIRRAADDGMTVYDLLAPGDGYKLEWADDATVVRDWTVANSLAGRAYAALYLGVFRKAVKRLLDRLPVGLRRRVTHAVTTFLGKKG